MKEYKAPVIELITSLDDEFCAENPASIADSLNYKHLNDVTIDLDSLEDWEG